MKQQSKVTITIQPTTNFGLEYVLILVNGVKAAEFMGLRMAITWVKKKFPDVEFVNI